MTSCEDRLAIINALGCVDDVFVEESMEKKEEYVLGFGADIVVFFMCLLLIHTCLFLTPWFLRV